MHWLASKKAQSQFVFFSLRQFTIAVFAVRGSGFRSSQANKGLSQEAKLGIVLDATTVKWCDDCWKAFYANTKLVVNVESGVGSLKSLHCLVQFLYTIFVCFMSRTPQSCACFFFTTAGVFSTNGKTHINSICNKILMSFGGSLDAAKPKMILWNLSAVVFRLSALS